MGDEEKKVPWLREDLEKIAENLEKVGEDSERDPDDATEPLLAALGGLRGLRDKVQSSPLSESARRDVGGRIDQKVEQAESALNLMLDVTLEATAVAPQSPPTGAAPEPAGLSVISPGQKFGVRVKLHNGSEFALQAGTITLDGLPRSPANQEKNGGTIQPGQDHEMLFLAQVPNGFAYTRPYWHRANPAEDAINTVDDAKYATLPFPPAPFHVTASYAVVAGNKAEGEISVPVLAPFVDAGGEPEKRKLAVAPEFSVMLEPGEQVIPVANRSASTVKVQVLCNLTGAPGGKLHLEAPQGWKLEPAEQAVELTQRGQSKDYEFKVFPASLREGRAQIRAVLDAGGKKYSEGYSVVSRPDLGNFYYYQPAVQRLSIVDVKVPKDLKIGYLMGAGDDLPTVIKQLGMDVTMIPAEQLLSLNLSGFGTIVLGIRAYDTQKDVANNNKKLLEYVSNGGTLLVQYNAAVGDFNSGHFTPYPAELSRERVSVEEAPVEMLDPQDEVLRYPNPITQRDFDGWVQERGLYFMDHWDAHFKPLLASHDPGEEPQKGGLLIAHYGKGTYIYTGYAFFRQLPAGVPGAIRLFVNLLSAGHETSN